MGLSSVVSARRRLGHVATGKLDDIVRIVVAVRGVTGGVVWPEAPVHMRAHIVMQARSSPK